MDSTMVILSMQNNKTKYLREMKEQIIEILESDYCDGGPTIGFIADKIIELISAEVERRVSERLPSEEDKEKMAIKYIKSLHIAKSLEYEAKYWFKNDFMAGVESMCSRMTEGGGK